MTNAMSVYTVDIKLGSLETILCWLWVLNFYLVCRIRIYYQLRKFRRQPSTTFLSILLVAVVVAVDL